MISLTIRTVIGAAATNTNALSGTDLEFLGQGGVLSIWGNGDIVGMTHSLRYSLSGTPVNPVPTSALRLASTVGDIKTDEDLLVARLAIPPGSRLVHQVTNPGAASNFNFQYLLE
jgi:hypothetical protein